MDDTRTPEEEQAHADYVWLQEQIRILTHEQEKLPRCGSDRPGGEEHCVWHLGHDSDHYGGGWGWPNYGPDGKGWRR